MNQFLFTLKDNNQKAFNSFFWFLFFLHFIAAAVRAFNATNNYQKNIAASSMAVFLLLTAFFFLFKNKIKQKNYQLVLLGLMVLFWLVQAAWLPALIVVMAVSLSFVILKKKSEAIFSAAEIIITRSVFKKNYSWAAVQNVILKDNLLSVDFKNNHLLQVELSTDNMSVDENSFNQFCKRQLNPKP